MEDIEQILSKEREFDIVIHTLHAAAEGLAAITEANMKCGMFTIMDQIRLEQIDQLEKAIKLWQNSTNV